MPLLTIAPFFLGGIALIAIPWLIHQIRKPEREPLVFSSLMFLPNVKKEVVERRRIQHLLLMLLRMALLILLALAFSRPYLKNRETTLLDNLPPDRHIILLDTSFSMRAGNQFQQAQKIASEVLDSLPSDAAVGVVAFGQLPKILSPLTSSGDRGRAKAAIANATFSQHGTQYTEALQFAERLILADTNEDENMTTKGVIHMVSDFQKVGVSENQSGWRLSGQVQFQGYEVGGQEIENLSITDIGIRKLPQGGLQIAGKIKNWSDRTEASTTVELFFEGQPHQEKPITVGPGNATLITFDIKDPGRTPVEGNLQIGPDDLDLDNRRYFVWKTARKKDVLLVSDPRPNEKWPPGWFLETALKPGVETPWRVRTVTQDEWVASFTGQASPDLLIVGDSSMLKRATAEAIKQFYRAGGRVLLMLNDRTEVKDYNRLLLNEMGTNSLGLRFANRSETQNEFISWVDLEHPSLLAFRGSRFNDFSSLRFNNYHRMEPLEGKSQNFRKLATFSYPENLPDAAILTTTQGPGEMVIWTFSPELAWTNLVKHLKFVPLLHESVRYLSRVRVAEPEYNVGNRYRVPKVGESPELIIHLPGSAKLEGDAVQPDQQLLFAESGVLKIRESRSEKWQEMEAVNLTVSESNPQRMGSREFALRFSSNNREPDQLEPGIETLSQNVEKKREFGFIFIILLAVFLAVETLFAAFQTGKSKLSGQESSAGGP